MAQVLTNGSAIAPKSLRTRIVVAFDNNVVMKASI